MTGPAIARMKTIDPRNSYLARQRLVYWEPALEPPNNWLPLLGRDDVTVRFSDEESGFADTGYASTIAGLGPFDMVESTGEPGTYYYDVQVTALQTPLLARLGSVIYQITEGAVGASGTYMLCVSLPLLVGQPRNPT